MYDGRYKSDKTIKEDINKLRLSHKTKMCIKNVSHKQEIIKKYISA